MYMNKQNTHTHTANHKPQIPYKSAIYRAQGGCWWDYIQCLKMRKRKRKKRKGKEKKEKNKKKGGKKGIESKIR